MAEKPWELDGLGFRSVPKPETVLADGLFMRTSRLFQLAIRAASSQPKQRVSSHDFHQEERNSNSSKQSHNRGESITQTIHHVIRARLTKEVTRRRDECDVSLRGTVPARHCAHTHAVSIVLPRCKLATRPATRANPVSQSPNTQRPHTLRPNIMYKYHRNFAG